MAIDETTELDTQAAPVGSTPLDPVPLTPWLEHLRVYLPVAREGVDSEGVHQVRTATRRLDAWLRLAGLRIYRDDLRWLRRQASMVRDLDVLLARELPAPLEQTFEERRDEAHVALREALEEPRRAGLVQGLAALPAIARAEALARLPEMAQAVLDNGLRLHEKPKKLKLYHRHRRWLRRLRYACEWLGLDAVALERLQNVFGALNDNVVLDGRVQAHSAADSMGDYRAGLKRSIKKQRKRALAAWDEVRPEVEALAQPSGLRPPTTPEVTE